MNNLKHITGEIRAIEKEERKIEFVISSEKIDRHGTIIPVTNWNLDNFNKNGIVGYQHDVYGSFFGDDSPDKIIGKGRAWIEGAELIGEVEFESSELNPLAEKIYQKLLFGSLTSTSVGFIETSAGESRELEIDGEKRKVYHYGTVELLEFSIVNLPSNTDALKRAVTEKQKAALKEAIREIESEKQEERERVANRLKLQQYEL